MGKKTSLFVYLLAFYVLLQFVWWAYHIIDLTATLNSDEAYIRKRILMILGEGAVFFSIVFFAIHQIRKSIIKDLELSRQQKNFLLAITHELKTPIASVKLYLQTLKKHKLDSNKQETLLDSALQENNRLQQIIDNILSVSQMDNSGFKLHPERLNLERAIHTAIEPAVVKNAAIFDLNCATDVHFNLDRNAWHSVLSNLLDNALKYAGDHPRIKIACQKIENELKITFEDNGQGVPEDKLEAIFQRFGRLEQEETRSSKGVGLGLYIVRELVKAMNGQIHAENVPTGGLKFELLFKS
jgi:signal transduction histidine kinase